MPLDGILVAQKKGEVGRRLELDRVVGIFFLAPHPCSVAHWPINSTETFQLLIDFREGC